MLRVICLRMSSEKELAGRETEAVVSWVPRYIPEALTEPIPTILVGL